MQYGFLLPGIVGILVVAALLFVPATRVNRAARGIVSAVVVLAATAATFAAVYPDLGSDWWLVGIGAVSVVTALLTTAYTAYLTGRLAECIVLDCHGHATDGHMMNVRRRGESTWGRH